MNDDGPSDRDRLEAIRRHTHGQLRYYATEFLHETGENRDLTRVYLVLAANYMGLIEGDRLDEGSMLERRGEIVDRYVKEAKDDPWTPPCSFCGESPTVAWFEGPDFRTFVDRAEKVRADEAWLACATCLSLVEASDRDLLVERGIDRHRRRHGRSDLEARQIGHMVRRGQMLFWDARSG